MMGQILVDNRDFCRPMLCISAAYVVMQCLSVRLSRSWIVSKRINISSKFFHHLVFPYQTEWLYSDGTPPPPNGGVECRWGRQKTRFWTNIWLRCIQIYSVVNRIRVAKCEKQSRDERRQASSTHRSSVVRTRGRRSVCDGLDVIRRRRREV